MTSLQAGSDGGTGIASSVHDVFPIMVFCLIEKGFDSRLSEAPSSCIEWFFLAPYDILGIGILVKVLL